MESPEQERPQGMPVARNVSLGELVSCQPGAIVSRTLLKKPTGSVTLFAFARGEALSEHTAPFDALVQVLEGEAEITISGKPLSAHAGEVVLMPANQPHAVKARTDVELLLTMIR